MSAFSAARPFFVSSVAVTNCDTTLIFSAKEAFYKCQSSLVRERLDFQDVRVEAAWGAAGGAFLIQATRGIAMSKHTAMPMPGRYLFHEGFVTAGMGLAAA